MTAKQRVELELEALNEKREKLIAFIASPSYQRLGFTAAKLLMMQQDAMSLYANILSLRLKTWSDIPVPKTPLEELAEECTTTIVEDEDDDEDEDSNYICQRCGKDVRNCTCDKGWK